MNRKTFFGLLFGIGLANPFKVEAKEPMGKIVKDHAKDTIQVRRLEIVDEKGNICGFIEERDGKMVLGSPLKKTEPAAQEVQIKNDFYYKSKLLYQEPDPSITFISEQ